MADFYKDIPILDVDKLDSDAMTTVTLRPPWASFGMTGRDWTEQPEGTFGSPPAEIELIPESEWDARYDEQEANQSSLEHLYLRGGQPAFVNLDQGQDGDCWAYSSCHAWMLNRLKHYGETPRLNPHFIARYLQRFNGGWCGASAKVLQEVGCPTEGLGPDQWPKFSHSALLTPERLAGAAKHKSLEEWRDLTRQEWNQKLTRSQVATCSFNNVPCAVDMNFWAHSVCAVRFVRVEAGSWGLLILNSWANWGRFGLAVLRGSQSIPDGAIAIRTTT